MQSFAVLPLRCSIILMMPPESLNWLERWCLARLIRAIASVIGVEPQRFGYVGFVEITRQVKQERSPAQQQAIVATVFDRLVPPSSAPWYAHSFARLAGFVSGMRGLPPASRAG